MKYFYLQSIFQKPHKISPIELIKQPLNTSKLLDQHWPIMHRLYTNIYYLYVCMYVCIFIHTLLCLSDRDSRRSALSDPVVCTAVKDLRRALFVCCSFLTSMDDNDCLLCESLATTLKQTYILQCYTTLTI